MNKITQLIRLKETDSTNREVFRLLQTQTLPEGTILITENQFAGRGQGQSSWESEPGKNLTFSLILRPVFLPPAEQFYLNQTIALGIKDCLEKFLPSDTISIKWPNDIYFANGKIAGILIENRILGSQFDLSVAGIGINVNQLTFLSNAPNPVSMINISGKSFILDHVLETCAENILSWYQVLKNQEFPKIKLAYITNLYGFGKWLGFKSSEKLFQGMISGVDDYGRLQIKEPNGHTHSFDFKEVSFML
jgi:BirA family biotin operon repressor/biotin-[acetyl-CoA-carboxylase] ligase